MSKFSLRADFKPTGDQPAAIAQLTQGLKDGLQHQTLLGVTGSGKSVTGDSKVLIQSGQGSYQLPINQFDAIFPSKLPATDDATQLALIKGQISTLSFDQSTGQTNYRPVQEISRHFYSGTMYKVIADNGTSNTFTDSHNVYVLRDGALTLLQSSQLRLGDYLPQPTIIPETNPGGLMHIDVREWLPEDNYFVEVVEPQRFASVVKGRSSWSKRQGFERLKIAEYRQLAANSFNESGDRIGSLSKKATIPVLIPATNKFWRFLGLFIAEGHVADKYLVISTGDASIINEISAGAACFGLKLKQRQKVYDYQISGSTVANLMRVLIGSHAAQKHLPALWPNCSNQQLGVLLSGLFAGDGWVESNSVCLSSASQELINQTQTALLRFGIHASVRLKNVKYKGQIHQNWVIRICGLNNLTAFAEKIGFGLNRKDYDLRLQLERQRVANTNVDVFQLPLDNIKAFSVAHGLFQRDLAKIMQVSRSLVSLYLSGRRSPARFRAQALFRYFAAMSTDMVEQDRWQQLDYLANLYWTPVKNITTKLVTRETVYDLAVPSDQTFLANSYFVHNTFTAANLIQDFQKPTLILSHNKTLAAQLYGEFKNFFPENAVHYFVSYFDYYQPEAYIARSDTFIEKDSQINEEIDRLRHAATDALLSRKDVIIVASVSCIYGIGSKEDYGGMSLDVSSKEIRKRDKMLRQLTDMQYQRNDIDFHRGTFRVRGDVVDIFPAGEELAYRLEFFGDEIERITQVDPLTGEILKTLEKLRIFPSSHYVTPQDKLKVAIRQIQSELEQRLAQFKMENKLLEAQRLEQRTRYDLEMLEETGFVKGIENYSRYLTNREPGEQPATLMDYFPDDYLLLIDESHMTMPQIRGMYNGDRARKEVLVEHGFRLPSALDNRPLTFTEFERHVNQAVYISATPADYELQRSPAPAQQVIRPTGLLDPPIDIRPVDGQVDDLIAEIRDTIAKHQRVLVTTLTKRMSEDLTEYLQELGMKVAYLHSDVDTLDRTDILRDLRLGVYDVLIGINLLREGLDLPEVSLVAILDADKEGFLRSEQALVQTVGRAARHVEGRVIMYADHVTRSMQATLDETTRRRAIQEAYNTEHGITPTGINRAVEAGMRPDMPEEAKRAKLDLKKIPKDEYKSLIKDLTGQMELASANLQFEQAAELRDLIDDIKKKM